MVNDGFHASWIMMIKVINTFTNCAAACRKKKVHQRIHHRLHGYHRWIISGFPKPKKLVRAHPDPTIHFPDDVLLSVQSFNLW
jgi:hypothetical protein